MKVQIKSRILFTWDLQSLLHLNGNIIKLHYRNSMYFVTFNNKVVSFKNGYNELNLKIFTI
jgi:hypothetical protein